MRDGPLLRRFSRTERAVHWIHATGFFALLTTGLILYLPALSGTVGRRGLVKAIHLYVALGWALALVLAVVCGNRRALASTRRDLERFDRDDLRWLAGWPAPQGRFNAGQKVHAVTQAAFAALFAGSGLLLWLGERNTALRFPGTIVLHDTITFIATALIIGHLYLSLIAPRTRPALRGMTRGSVPAKWATEHHPKWVNQLADSALDRRTGTPDSWPRRGVLRTVIGAGIAIAGFSVWASAQPGRGQPAASALARAPVPPLLARGTALARQALALDDAGDLKAAVVLYAQAASTLPGSAELRTAFGSALARSARTADAVRQLQLAVELDPSAPTSRIYLAAELIREGHRTQARFQLRRALALDPVGPTAQAARHLLGARP
jgi:formate dehydrogenase subunit gamma